MARLFADRNSGPILEAAGLWRKVGLLEEGSVFSHHRLWTSEHLLALQKHFVEQPDVGEGSFFADSKTLDALESQDRVVFRYVSESGEATRKSNPNGSLANIAGICNQQRNVLGMMPHPDRAWDLRLGSEDGKVLFESLIENLESA